MRQLKKTIQFDSFRPYYCVFQNDRPVESAYDLSVLLEHTSQNSLKESKRKIYGDIHMIHKSGRISNSNMWEIQLIHLREKMLPGIADGDGSFEMIQLDEHEYPAESTTFLYNESNGILYLQRNKYGTSIKALEFYLGDLSPEGTSVLLKPIIVGQRIKKIIDTTQYRNIILAADTEGITNTDVEEPSTPLNKLLKELSSYQGRIIRLEISAGRERCRRLESQNTKDLILDAYKSPATTKLIVKASAHEDVGFETIDLLNDREKYQIDLKYTKNNPITHDMLVNEFMRIYTKIDE